MHIAGVVIVILAVIAVTIAFAWGLQRTYLDRRESNLLTSSLSTLAISVTLLCVLLIPVDIYIVSSGLNHDGSQADPGLTRRTAEGLQSLYYALYIALLAFAFLLLPFAYFYFESGDEEEVSVASRAWGAAKYTLGFLLFFVVLLVLGIVLKKGKHNDDADWKDRLTNDFSNGEAVLSFCIGCLACVGLCGYVVYAAYGLARFPMKLMSRAKVQAPSAARRLPSESSSSTGLLAAHRSRAQLELGEVNQEDLELSLRRNQENIQYLQSKYELPGRPWSKEDVRQMNDLRREQRRLQSLRQSRLRTGAQRAQAEELSCWDKCWNALVPIRMAVAIPLLLLSLLIVVSLAITVVDKFKHSTCGPGCGYALGKTRLFNPIDELLRQLAKAFPIDTLFFGGLALYIFLASVSGVVGLGVRLFVYKLYSVQKGRTAPNAFLMAAWVFQLMTLALNMEVINISPTYATFGNQFYLNATSGERQACDSHMIGLYPDTCVPTQVGRFISTMGIETPFFNVLLFYGNLAFLLFFILFLGYGALCADNSKREEVDEFRRLDDLSD